MTLKATQPLGLVDVERLAFLAVYDRNIALSIALGHLLSRMKELPEGSEILLTATVLEGEAKREWLEGIPAGSEIYS